MIKETLYGLGVCPRMGKKGEGSRESEVKSQSKANATSAISSKNDISWIGCVAGCVALGLNI